MLACAYHKGNETNAGWEFFATHLARSGLFEENDDNQFDIGDWIGFFFVCCFIYPTSLLFLVLLADGRSSIDRMKNAFTRENVTGLTTRVARYRDTIHVVRNKYTSISKKWHLEFDSNYLIF